jgi:hypothetical protein
MNFVLLIFIFQLALFQNGTHTNKNCFVFNSHNMSAYDLKSLMYLKYIQLAAPLIMKEEPSIMES